MRAGDARAARGSRPPVPPRRRGEEGRSCAATGAGYRGSHGNASLGASARLAPLPPHGTQIHPEGRAWPFLRRSSTDVMPTPAPTEYLTELHLKRCRVARRLPSGSAAYFVLTQPYDVRVFGIEYRAPTGYATNFASVPWCARWLISTIGRWTEASVIHDAGCDNVLEKRVASSPASAQWQPANVSRREIDRILLALMQTAGVRRWRAVVIYAAVRVYAMVRCKS